MRSLMSFAFAVLMSFPGLPSIVHAADVPNRVHRPLDVNDISWLFPMPKEAADFDKAISLRDVLGPPAEAGSSSGPAWSDSAMTQYFAIAGKFGTVEGTDFSINLPDNLKDRAVWHIAGIRIDPGAPGASDVVAAQFGRQPQIRLIVQPVIRKADGKPEVLDIAAHLIFSFASGRDPEAQPGCFQRPVPDMAKLGAIAADALALKQRLAKGEIGGQKITTGGIALGVHPAFKTEATATAFRAEILAFLNRHLPNARLSSMAVAGLPEASPEPWIFLAMALVAPDKYMEVRSPALSGSQFAQMLSFVGPDRIVPAPEPNNLNPITCQHAALPSPLPVTGRKGLATAELFDGAPTKARAREIVDLIGDPQRSHFFNTDCLSCHTDTRLGIDILGLGAFPGIDKDVLPKSEWNVRNFGWFPDQGPTATNRTLQETLESLVFFNEQVLESQSP